MSPYCDDNQDGSVYNLIANIRHNGTTKDFWYNLHLLQKSNDKWYDIQDLIVEEAVPPLIALSEAYIQFYERVDTNPQEKIESTDNSSFENKMDTTTATAPKTTTTTATTTNTTTTTLEQI
eukprot:TRINITY_DN5229_c0_g2_i1.p1 TRINITY_DN5229_c0_g2~~TRINITY_DN5229_c0_g2_i1.p1  ORF type:complete len:131 (-),score=34.74 TRINITY_DN5229_c0_g2_i1:57-419(-)